MLWLSPAGAAEAPGYAGVSPFDLPRLTGAERSALRLIEQGAPESALRVIEGLAAEAPQAAAIRVAQAAALVRLDRLQEAETALRAAEATAPALVARVLTLPLFARLAGSFAGDPPTAAPPPPPPPPIEIRDGVAAITADAVAWDPARALLTARFAFSPSATAPLTDDRTDGVRRLLKLWAATGTAAGNHGDLYDNRDGGHSVAWLSRMPQVGRITYPADLGRRFGLTYGLNQSFAFDAVVFGNSSTALTTGSTWRSLPRFAMTSPEGAYRLFQQYAQNALYVYPEHKDHDSAPDGFGDLFPANTPYILISQGSSGSDRAFLEAIGSILAAFRPEVKAFLRGRGLIAPTVQMIFRRNRTDIRSDAHYMSALAHPSAFSSRTIALERMIRHAQALEAGAVPPMVRLRLVEARALDPAADAVTGPADATLFETPGAIARVWRRGLGEEVLTVSAAATADPNGRPLRFHWRVLRGDPTRIRIEPLDDGAATVRLSIPFHDRMLVPGSATLTTDRVEIAAFADNGAGLSAPAFVTVMMPADEGRVQDASGRVTRIDHADPARADRYVDPLIFPQRPWSDAYAYDDAGRLTGWTRTGAAGEEAFTAQGHRVLGRDPAGRPDRSAAVTYRAEPGADGRLRLVAAASGPIFRQVYADETDRVGVPVPALP